MVSLNKNIQILILRWVCVLLLIVVCVLVIDKETPRYNKLEIVQFYSEIDRWAILEMQEDYKGGNLDTFAELEIGKVLEYKPTFKLKITEKVGRLPSSYTQRYNFEVIK